MIKHKAALSAYLLVAGAAIAVVILRARGLA